MRVGVRTGWFSVPEGRNVYRTIGPPPTLKDPEERNVWVNASTLRSVVAEELFTATSSINIWSLCGQDRIY